MNVITKAAKSFSYRAREKRRGIFLNIFTIDEDTKILDLRSRNVSHINMVPHGINVNPANVFIADIDSDAAHEGHSLLGFTPVVIDETGPLSFPDDFFDIIYYSTVIDHVTMPKKDVWTMYSGPRFLQGSRKRQQSFAKFFERLGKQY